jgi:hypothetical protein
MTSLQKAIVQSLLDGCNIATYRNGNFRLRTANNCVISKFYEPTFDSLKFILRKEKNGLYVIDKKAVRSLHGKTWIKKEYRKAVAKP